MKSKTTAGALALLLGGIGVHQFYLGNKTRGLLYILFCWTAIPLILAFVDAFVLLTMSEDRFDAKYNGRALASA